MTCEIHSKIRKLDGPYGPSTLDMRCVTHGFDMSHIAQSTLTGNLCPIGQIEAATEKAMTQILAMADQRDPATENVGYDNAPTDPHHGGKLVTVANLGPSLIPPKRPRKPKTEE